jgi:hypothetical protein
MDNSNILTSSIQEEKQQQQQQQQQQQHQRQDTGMQEDSSFVLEAVEHAVVQVCV